MATDKAGGTGDEYFGDFIFPLKQKLKAYLTTGVAEVTEKSGAREILNENIWKMFSVRCFGSI